MSNLVTSLLLAAHLLALNLASVGPLVCAWLQVRRSRGDELAGVLGRRLVVASMLALGLGIGLGLGQLVHLWLSGDKGYMEVLRRLPWDAYAFAGGELLFSLLCLSVYLATWNWGGRRPWLHGLLPLLSATNLLYHFPPLMAAMQLLAQRPELVIEEIVTRRAIRAVMVRPEVLALTLHFIVASIAVAGLALMLLAKHDGDGDFNAVARDRLTRGGATLALVPTVLQIVVGVWLLVALPADARGNLMGGHGLASFTFVGSFVTALGLMQNLATVALGETSSAAVRKCGWLLLATVLLMVAAMVHAR